MKTNIDSKTYNNEVNQQIYKRNLVKFVKIDSQF